MSLWHSLQAQTIPSVIPAWDGILGHKINKRFKSLFHAIHSPFYWQILKKTIVYSGFKNPYKNYPWNKKTRVYSWIAFCRTEKEGRKPDKNLSLRRIEFLPITSNKNAWFKNSISGLWCDFAVTFVTFIFLIFLVIFLWLSCRIEVKIVLERVTAWWLTHKNWTHVWWPSLPANPFIS